MTDFEIKGPGKYKTRDGRMAVVERLGDAYLHGKILDPHDNIVLYSHTWLKSGEARCWSSTRNDDIIGPWEEDVTFTESMVALLKDWSVYYDKNYNEFLMRNEDSPTGYSLCTGESERYVGEAELLYDKWIIKRPEPDYKGSLKELAHVASEVMQYEAMTKASKAYETAQREEVIDKLYDLLQHNPSIKSLLTENTK